MPQPPPRPVQGQVLTADYLGQLYDWIASMEVDVAQDSGLELATSPTRRTIGLVRPAFAKHFFITSWSSAGNGGDTPGQGQGIMCNFDPASGKYEPTGVTGVPLYADAGASLPVDTYAQFLLKDGQWFYDVQACSPPTYSGGPTAGAGGG